MPRAKIPYEELERKAKRKYPAPAFNDVRLYPDTPIRVYDRSTGNYAPIGWKVRVFFRQFTEFSSSLRPIYENKSETIVIFTD